jgi:hypothetical protein
LTLSDSFSSDTTVVTTQRECCNLMIHSVCLGLWSLPTVSNLFVIGSSSSCRIQFCIFPVISVQAGNRPSSTHSTFHFRPVTDPVPHTPHLHARRRRNSKCGFSFLNGSRETDRRTDRLKTAIIKASLFE